MRVATENVKRLSKALERCVNNPYAAKLILGIDDLKCCSEAEKDAVILLLNSNV